jgi:hypothetical protein
MNRSVFAHMEFWVLICFSLIVPVAIYWRLLTKRTVSQTAVLLLGLALICVAGVDVYLLQVLKLLARASAMLADDLIFTSEISFALYLLPALFGGVGINLVSHVLINHLRGAEKRFEDEHSKEVTRGPALKEARHYLQTTRLQGFPPQGPP